MTHFVSFHYFYDVHYTFIIVIITPAKEVVLVALVCLFVGYFQWCVLANLDSIKF